jgi:Leucine-rich repeat (LRR) protein
VKKLMLLLCCCLGSTNYSFSHLLGFTHYADYDKIVYLNLSNKGLTTLPDNIRHMVNLQDLVLNNNKLYSLSAKLIYCKKLKRIELGSNEFTCVPTMLTQFPELEHIGLEDNNLISFPDDFHRLQSLKSLDLSNVHNSFSRSYNTFNEVPVTVCKLRNLERLLLEKLPLTRLPPEFTELKKLKVLSLSGNTGMDWKQVLQILSHLPELEVLSISFIGRSYLPPEIGNLKNLKLIIWKEEMAINQWYLPRLKELLPNTRVLIGGPGEYLPFLRGNSTATILRIAREG